MAEDFYIHALLMAALGQIALTVSLLMLRRGRLNVYWPVMVLFVASGISCTLPTFILFWPKLELYGLAIVLPLFVIQPVCLWLYVCALCSPTSWRFYRFRHGVHFIPLVVALAVSTFLTALPQTDLQALFIDYNQEPASGLAEGLIVAAFLLMVFWAIQSAIYITLSVLRLKQYQQQIKQVFASTQGRELAWLIAFVFIVGGAWLLSISFLLPSFAVRAIELPAEYFAAVYLLLIWFVSLWSLRSKPGFEGHYLKDDVAEVAIAKQPAQKYRKSALDENHQLRIKDKVLHAMKEEKLYLQENITLLSLAEHLAVSPNYLSQTLNQTLGESFFDFINRWRVEHAKAGLLNSRASVLDVAMEAGFNARSSFYKAFKKETGQTPTEYRKLNTK